MGGLASRAAELSERLAESVQSVCRHYLPKGRREGRYWMIGDVAGTPGRSLYVRLFDTGRGRIGNWVDAATGEHGDLLDLIRFNQRHDRLAETIAEAERFLALPPVLDCDRREQVRREPPARSGSPHAARRLFAAARPLAGTLAAAYLRARGITRVADLAPLRFHPRCFYRSGEDDAPNTPGSFPAMIAAVTDLAGKQTGAHRTWLDPNGSSKAPVASPRRAMGEILGHGVRFGSPDDVMIAGEGIETMLSLREALPAMPMIAATSSAHLAAILFPPSLRRLYMARERDAAGNAAFELLGERAGSAGIDLLPLDPDLGDFNDDLRRAGDAAIGDRVAVQLDAADRARFCVRAS